jgi:molecular chaperone DnaK (HSP70)
VAREARERYVYLSTVTAAELIFGARRSVRAAENLDRYAKLASRLRVVRPDAATAVHYADLRLHAEAAGHPIPQNDLWQAALARQMVRAAEAALGRRIEEAVVGRPVRFSQDARKDEAARRRLEEAWGMAGIERVRFLEEPVAAAHHYAAEAQLAPGAHMLVFDFGGGTLDVTVARAAREGIEVLGTGGVPVGGDLLAHLPHPNWSHGRDVESLIAPLLQAGEGTE